MGMFKLRLEIDPKNFEKLEEIRARLDDFSIPFASIIAEWAEGNKRRKFAKGVGAERTGVDQTTASWQPVTESYYRQKHGPIVRGNRTLYPDWLMVKTGALMEALSTVGGFSEYKDAHRAVFGTPLNPESAAAASGNKEKRPTVFLDRTDHGVIRRELQRYLSLGEGYKQILKEISGRKYAALKQTRELNLSFSETVGP